MAESATFKKEILARKVGLLYSQQLGGVVVNLSVSLGLFFMFLPIMAGMKLYLWGIGSVAVIALRLADYLSYRRTETTRLSGTLPWHLRFAAGSTAQGVLWGLAGFFLFPSANLAHQIFLVVILCGMAGGAIIFLSPLYHVYLLYLIPTLLPASVRIFLEQGEDYFSVGLLGLVYMFGMGYASWKTSRWMDSSLRLTLEKETIADELKKAHEQLEARVAVRTAELKTANENLKEEIEKKNQAEYALKAEKERLAVTLRSIAEGVIATDIAGKIIFLNRVAEELTQWKQEDAVGRRLAEIFHIADSRTGKRWEDPFPLIFESAPVNGLANHTLLIAEDGAERAIAMSGAPITDKDNKRIGAVLVFRDMTEINRTEEELLKIKKLESLGVLAGGIAHDFNNILMAILGNIDLLLLSTELAAPARRRLDEAEKAIIRAKDLTTQLLTFSKGGEPIKETASLADVIRESATFILRGSAVSCSFAIADDLWLVSIDRGQISQVIQNIVLNASQAMPEGGVVEVACRNVQPFQGAGVLFPQDRKHVEITIKDTGVGIAADNIDKVFDPYFSTKQQGSGLGLAITHSIIRKHGGHISVQSAPGRGTIFTICLPAVEEQLEKKQQEEKPKSPADPAKILVMDDDEMVGEVAVNMLTKLGHTVIYAKDGLEAVQLYAESANAGQPIDLIIMDLTVPGGMGGREAAKKISTIKPDAKMVVSSGYSNDPIMANFAKYGFCAAIVKPYLFQELKRVVHDALRERHSSKSFSYAAAGD